MSESHLFLISAIAWVFVTSISLFSFFVGVKIGHSLTIDILKKAIEKEIE
jgi:multisubunit Na+/H+ antiporter MnhE subunit